ncbi:MAG: SCP2 sterol-binding domain-containing protein [Deltaproteobacteria bacterium]|nr:SCP2 sterol-binding domain-containing protein [Deltaproteobacteria bacterium]
MKKELKDKLFKRLKTPLRYTPLVFQTIGAGVIISEIVERNPRFKRRLKELQGKHFLFKATDTGKAFHMEITKDNIKVTPHSADKPDVTMQGELEILLDLLLGDIDPDTVFFSRRLEISGDTSTAILFKNILADC